MALERKNPSPAAAVAERRLGAGAPAEAGPGERGERFSLRDLFDFVLLQPLGATGGLLVLVLVVTAIFAPWLAPHPPKLAAFAPYVPPGGSFLLGTDHLGRDVLSRLIWGARLSLYVGLLSVGVGVTLGALWGVLTGYFGGWPDTASQRVVDTLMAFPPIILALGFMAALGQSVTNVVITLAILLTPTAARTMRASALSIREMGYVEAARATGSSHWVIVSRHILPNCLAPYLVLFSVNIAYAIVVEAALSFLGVGSPADEPSWGGMLTASSDYLQRAPWLPLLPGAAISLTVFGLNLLGDAIRDAVDPRLRGRGVRARGELG